jgi:hypothetical protein
MLVGKSLNQRARQRECCPLKIILEDVHYKLVKFVGLERLNVIMNDPVAGAVIRWKWNVVITRLQLASAPF